MKLTASERAALAQKLLASLDEDAEIEDAWAVEVERRVAELDSGLVHANLLEEALAQIRSDLHQRC